MVVVFLWMWTFFFVSPLPWAKQGLILSGSFGDMTD